jgi:formate hydrogenlyase transcriptional activator
MGTLNVGSSRPSTFSQDDVELLGQVAQQIAIAVENGLAYRQIAQLKEKVNTKKLYLEEEIRTEQNFEEIVGTSAAKARHRTTRRAPALRQTSCCR